LSVSRECLEEFFLAKHWFYFLLLPIVFMLLKRFLTFF
jgi:hypothetical protein